MKITFLLLLALTCCWVEKTAAQNVARLKLTLDIQGKLDDLAFSPDSKLVAATSNRLTLVRLWDTDNGKLRARFSGRELDSVRFGYVANEPNYLSFSPDGKIVAFIGFEIKEVRLWNVETGELHMALTNLESGATFSPDGRLLALAAGPRGLQVLDVYSRRIVNTRWDLNDMPSVLSADFSEDGATLIVRIVSSKRQAAFYLFDVSTGKLKATVPAINGNPAVKWIRAWNVFVAIDSNNNLNLMDATGQVKSITTGIKGKISKVAFSPDRKTIALTSKDRMVRLYDSAADVMKVLLIRHEQIPSFATFSPDGKIFVTEDKTGLRIWDPVTGELKQTLTEARSPFEFSPDGSMLLTAAKGMTALMWQISIR